jgi:hypothetical protein
VQEETEKENLLILLISQIVRFNKILLPLWVATSKLSGKMNIVQEDDFA